MVKQLLYRPWGVIAGISILPEKWMKSEKVMGASIWGHFLFYWLSYYLRRE